MRLSTTEYHIFSDTETIHEESKPVPHSLLFPPSQQRPHCLTHSTWSLITSFCQVIKDTSRKKYREYPFYTIRGLVFILKIRHLRRY